MSKDDFGIEGAEGAEDIVSGMHVAVVLSDGCMVEGYADEDFMTYEWLKITNASEVKTIMPGYSIGAIQSAVLKDKCLRFAIPAGAYIPKDHVQMMLPIFEW